MVSLSLHFQIICLNGKVTEVGRGTSPGNAIGEDQARLHGSEHSQIAQSKEKRTNWADFLKGALSVALVSLAGPLGAQDVGQFGVETDLPPLDGEPSSTKPHDPHKGAVTNLPISALCQLEGQ